MLPEQFWGLTYRELHYMAAGYRQRQREFVLPFRELFSLIHNVHVEKDHQKPAAELWPLPGDKKPEQAKPWTEEDTADMFARLRARDAKLKA